MGFPAKKPKRKAVKAVPAARGKRGAQTVRDGVLANLQGAHGAANVMRLGDRNAVVRGEVKEVIPTGIAPLDLDVLGIGGLPVGRIVEIYSREGVGKSSLLWHLLRSVQRAGGTGFLVEVEHAMQREHVDSFGVNTGDLLLGNPETLEEGLGMLGSFLRSVPAENGPYLLGFDSVAAAQTKLEIDAVMGESAVAERARKMSAACRQLIPLAAKKRATIVFINQIRDKIGVMFGDKSTTPGGHALRFYASIRLELRHAGTIKDTKERAVGKDLGIKCVKNKFGPSFKQCEARLMFGHGFDLETTFLSYAKDRKLIEPRSKGWKAVRVAAEKLGPEWVKYAAAHGLLDDVEM